MKTKKQVIAENPDCKNLICAVIARIGMGNVANVSNHGIDGGYNGFIYTEDTVKFYKRNKKEILEMAEKMADALGEDTISMIRNFRCLGNGLRGKDCKLDYRQSEIAEALYSGEGESADIIQNAMAWYAAEEVCRMFED